MKINRLAKTRPQKPRYDLDSYIPSGFSQAARAPSRKISPLLPQRIRQRPIRRAAPRFPRLALRCPTLLGPNVSPIRTRKRKRPSKKLLPNHRRNLLALSRYPEAHVLLFLHSPLVTRH